MKSFLDEPNRNINSDSSITLIIRMGERRRETHTAPSYYILYTILITII